MSKKPEPDIVVCICPGCGWKVRIDQGYFAAFPFNLGKEMSCPGCSKRMSLGEWLKHTEKS
jgi:RNase P subunit RPR2